MADEDGYAEITIVGRERPVAVAPSVGKQVVTAMTAKQDFVTLVDIDGIVSFVRTSAVSMVRHYRD